MNGLLSAFASAVLLVTSAFTGAVLMEENGNVWTVEKNQSSEDNSLRTNDVNLLPLVNNLDEDDAPHIKSTTGLDNHFKPGVERQGDSIAESVCKGKYIPDGRNDGKVTIIENTDNLNRDPIFTVDEYIKFDGVDGEIMSSASVGSTVLSISLNFEEIKVTYRIVESVCKGKYVPDGRNDGKVLSLKNVQVVSIRVDSLSNGLTQDVPVFYKPHYNDWTGRVVPTHAVMDAGNLGDLVYKASQNNNNNAEAAIDPNETSDTCDNVDGDGSLVNTGNTSLGDGPVDAVSITTWINIAIWILNQDLDNDGDTMADEIIEWIIDVFTQDEEGNEEGGEEEGGEEGGEEEGGEEEGGEEEEGDEEGGGEDGGGSDREE